MAFILNIETSTTVCSVSLSKNGELISFKEINDGFTHAENLHVFIEEVLKTATVSIKELNAVAISKGPGSYTGLRIGVSAAKGLAFSLNIPLIALDTLQIMTNSALIKNESNAVYCPMIDARRMEIYTAVYDKDLKQLKETEALIVDENSIQPFSEFEKIYFFGDGMQKCKEVLSTIKSANFIDAILPSAKNMCDLSYKKYLEKQFEDVAYFEPFYLKDFLILTKKNA
ncbi:MAG: tRNA (adenosine(37)-N6)-threonylcarbamoyltransferase complex dimerization subunit type 1 TsaB [Bacteroidota bacterium]|nr:tRNA (adenosine(37)-N6)-threonylcarbamoyltransferase complex dimerization subunit type 1 TsaB [Bacteroidota bacterium]